MLTEIQTIILTCLLGPEDKGAFKRTLNAAKARRFRARRPTYEKEYRQAHLEEVRRADRESKRKARQDPVFKAYEQVENRDWVKNNPEKARESRKTARAKQRRLDPVSKLAPNLRSRMVALLKGTSKSASTLKLLGCSIPEWKAHLEMLFKPGMTWKNYGPVWHIDHIKPCAVFDLTDPEQQRVCFHWSNTQPLFAAENMAKGGRYAG